MRRAALTDACASLPPPLEAALRWACSSVVEHCVDIAGVASSILATPTIQKPRKSEDFRGFLASGWHRFRVPARPDLTDFDQFSPNDLGACWARSRFAVPRLYPGGVLVRAEMAPHPSGLRWPARCKGRNCARGPSVIGGCWAGGCGPTWCFPLERKEKLRPIGF